MKISNSKKQLAKIIHENGGWRDGANFSAKDSGGDAYPGRVCFYLNRPTIRPGDTRWHDVGRGMVGDARGCICGANAASNWHQTILSRDEYFYLYPVIEAAPEPVPEVKQTIEQLAADYRNRKDYADRKQQEADAAKADAGVKLAELVAAGEALGLVLSVVGAEPEPELVITDWRDLRVGDEIRCTEGTWASCFIGRIGVVVEVEDPSYTGCIPLMVEVDGESDWGDNFYFIRRPAKGDANA